MKSLGIASEFDVPRNITHGVPPSRILRTMHPLVLQRGEEGLGHGVVIADSGSTNRLTNPELLECSDEGR